MGLRLIFGKSGTGKSQFCFDEAKKNIHGNNKIYIITPEQFSFTAEKKLLDIMENDAVINAEVLTFKRMAYRVMNEIGGGIKTHLTVSGKAMLIYNILLDKKKNLKFLNKSDENTQLIIYTLTECKKHNVTISELEELSKNTNDKYLEIKLNDMLTIYKEFENSIQNKYIDENDVLTILYNQIDETKEFENSIIYIDEFSGFTKQEYNIIEKLLEVSKQVNITICTDDLEITENADVDIFYSNKLTSQKLYDLAKEKNINIEKPINLNENYRFKSQELNHLSKNIYAPRYKIYNAPVKDIKLFLAKNSYSEIENVANEIIKLVRDNDYRYKDISIISKNISTYSSIAKVIFEKYNIPVFIDEKKDLSQNILVKYILAVLEVFSRNWSYESVFNYIKTGFIDIEDDDIYILENYCLKWGIKGNKWLKEWTYGNLTKDDEIQIKRINEIRKIVITPLIQFKEKIDKSKKVNSITEAIYNLLIENKIDVKLEEKIKLLEEKGRFDISKEYSISWNIVLELLDEIVLVFRDEKITFEKYAELLKIGLGNSELGKIPTTSDQIIMGDVDRSRSHKVKAIFIIGINDGVFPSVHRDEGFLNDNDRKILKDNNLEIARGTLDALYEDNFNIYKALTTAEEKLYLSYSSTNSEGKSLRAAVLISKIKKIFINLKEESDIINQVQEITNKKEAFEQLLINLRKYRDGEKIDPIWFSVYNYFINSDWKSKLEFSLKGLDYTNIPDKINKENIEKLYGNTLKTSISRLEQYKSCPFSFYLKYGLKLSEKNNFKVQAIDTGTFMHDVIDEFFETLKTSNRSVKNMEDDDIEKLINEIIEEKLKLNKNYIFTSTEKYKLLVTRLKRVILKSMKYIINSLKMSDFDVYGNEVEFKNGAEYKPIILDLEDGRKVEITGKIDRIDIGQNQDGKYIRIIDYKSSIKNIDLNEVMYGLQLQLLTYLDATCKIEDVMPAGVLYFNLIDPIIKSNKNLDDEEIENEIRKKFKMQGLILADINVVQMMDKSLTTGSSSIIPAYIDSKGNLSNSRSNAVNKEQFEFLQKYINKIIKQISEEILSGDIGLKPYYSAKKKKAPCDYCEYKAICQFNPSECNNNYNYIPNLSKEIILEKISKQ